MFKFTFQAYNNGYNQYGYNSNEGNYGWGSAVYYYGNKYDACTITVRADSEKEAIGKVNKIITRDSITLTNVEEIIDINWR